MMPYELPDLYTSRWHNKELADLDVVPVGISRGTPRFKLPYRYRLLRLLAPSREAFVLRDDIEFDKAYVAGLEKIGVEKIITTLRLISEEHSGKPLALLCYEDVHAGQDCHRRMLAKWIEEKTGQEVPELTTNTLSAKRRPPAQESLFEAKELRKGD